MPRLWWFALLGVGAFLVYTAWQRSQMTPRVPVTGGSSSSSSSSGGLLDGLTRTIDKVKGVFDALGGGGESSATTRPAPSSPSTGVAWV